MLALFGINNSQRRVKKSVTYQMFAKAIYNELVCMERWDKVCTSLLGEVPRIDDCEKSEVARENCQTTIQA